MDPQVLKNRIRNAAFAFRGYNVSNLGRSQEFLDHPTYGSLTRSTLAEVSAIVSAATKSTLDIEQRIRSGHETSLDTFADDVGVIVGMELAHIRCLEQFFDVPYKNSRASFGYSLGELPALFLGGVYEMQHLLPLPLLFADDCVDLAHDVKMGILFTRAELLSAEAVRRLCVIISSEGDGLVAPSAYLSPNTALLLGQRDTLRRFRKAMPNYFSQNVKFREDTHRWPPLHTPLLAERNIANRAFMALHAAPGGFVKPTPPVISCVTGKASYNDYNSRDHLIRWIDQPQLLWDVIYETLVMGIDLVLHVGPEPNLIPATYERLSNNVTSQLGNRFFRRLGRRVLTGFARQSWLTPVLPSKAALLRAPFVEHIVLEDWLLEQKPA